MDLPALRTRILDTALQALPQLEGRYLSDYSSMLADYPQRGGKALRGILTVITGLALGGTIEQLLPSAAALELFQNWALIHDDIEDESEERRGKPALHHLHGIPLAINAGDALHGRMWAILVEQGNMAVMQEFVRLVDMTALGQHLEMSWMKHHDLNLTPQDYLGMVSKKAAYYTAVAPLRLGHLALGIQPPACLEQAGLKLGQGFQIVDDTLNLSGDPKLYGKEIAGDLYEGKRTLVLLDFLQQASPEQHAFTSQLLAQPRERKQPQDVHQLHQWILESGAVQRAEQYAEGLLEEGLEGLALFAEAPYNAYGQQLLTILESLIKRQA